MFYFCVVCSTRRWQQSTVPLSQSPNRHRKAYRLTDIKFFLLENCKTVFYFFYTICLQSYNTRNQNIPVCIYLTYPLLLSSLLCPYYWAGIHEMAPTAIVNGVHERRQDQFFRLLTLPGRFSLWNFMYSLQGHLESLEYNSTPKIFMLIGGIRWYRWHSVAFSGVRWHSLFRHTHILSRGRTCAPQSSYRWSLA